MLTRRVALAVCLTMYASTALGQAGKLDPSISELSVEEAYDFAVEGKIVLVDIRRPDEWALTGVGEGAHSLDMRRKDFLAELEKLVNGDKTTPVAVMCARGVRSKWLSAQLKKSGFKHIVDVPEGMLGSRAGPGWLRTGLPVTK